MTPSNAKVQFSLSHDGDLVYLEGRSDDNRDAAQPLVWLDRQGTEQPLTEARQRFSKPRLTADGRTVFVEVADPEPAIWAYDLNRGTLTRMTHGGVSYGPIPSPDGTRVAYRATRDGVAGALLTVLFGSLLGLLIGVPIIWLRGRLTLLGSYLPLGTFLAAGLRAAALKITRLRLRPCCGPCPRRSAWPPRWSRSSGQASWSARCPAPASSKSCRPCS